MIPRRPAEGAASATEDPATSGRPPLHRVTLRRAALSPASGAVAAQLTQAFGSFLIQLMAARFLGSEGFGRFAFMLGVMIMATAVSSGLVGDSLTILDRSDRGTRSALRRVGAGVMLVAFVVCVALGLALGSADPWLAVTFALATTAYIAEDLGRRMLMAELRFWRLPVVDLSVIVAALTVLATSAWLGDLTLHSFVLAVLGGQLTGLVVALTLHSTATVQPPDAPRIHRARQLLSFGKWRAAQQLIQPTLLNLNRSVILLAAGTAAVGQVEAARVFVAPAMLLAQGAGYYLFATYAQDSGKDVEVLLERTDRAAARLLLASLTIGSLVAAGLPLGERLLTAGQFSISPVAVFGWAVYAAVAGSYLAFGSLAMARGHQGVYLGVRLVDSSVSLGVVALGLLGFGLMPSWSPWLLALGTVVGAFLCRRILRSRMRRDASGVPADAHRASPDLGGA